MCELFQIFSNIYFGIEYLKKSDKKNLELCQVFMYDFLWYNGKMFIKILVYNFLWRNISVYLYYCLALRIPILLQQNVTSPEC